MKRIWILYGAALILLLLLVSRFGSDPLAEPIRQGAEAIYSKPVPSSNSKLETVDPKTSSPDVDPSTPAHVSDLLAAVLTLENIPDGHFKRELEQLSVAVRKRVLLTLEESPQLLKDVDSIHVDEEGMIYYVCKMEHGPSALDEVPVSGAETVSMAEPVFDGPVSNSVPPIYHSRPGSSKVLFLDFNGHDISGTKWNLNTNYAMPATWVCLPYDTDEDNLMFSVEEQEIIYEVWQRVAEDYAPFDVDVTTEEPAVWTRYTGHALITPRTDENGIECPHFGYGGIAYRGVFARSDYSYNDQPCYSPAWVKDDNAADDIAEIVSHELGHNLGLSHDGDTTGDAYYEGHRNGSMSWGAIMGTAYNENVSQWSKGEYYRANNTTEDDLAMIAGKLAYIADDHGDTPATATTLPTDAGGAFSVTGCVEQTDDPDVFSLVVSSNALLRAEVQVLRLDSVTRGANLDALLELRDSAGTLVSSNNYELGVSAVVEAELSPGTYYLYVKPTGVGSPLQAVPTGYTTYGSLGQYGLVGTLGVISTNPGTVPPITNEFESGFEDWVQRADDDTDWTHNHYTPTTTTGPKDGAGSDYFLFTEANSHSMYRIALIEKTFDFSLFETASLEFKYHMYGDDMGSLSVDVFDGVWHENIWKRIGQQHTSETDAWTTSTVDLDEYALKSGVKIRFRGIVGTWVHSDMAIDQVSITGVLHPDIDLDGLPNDWEEFYFGGITNAISSSMASNGINTLLETYIAGLNPTNPASVFKLSNDRNSLQWDAATGRVYRVYWTSNLLSGFQIVETNYTGSFTDTVHEADQKGFYKIDVDLEP